jgi:uncharacterized membrane protein
MKLNSNMIRTTRGGDSMQSKILAILGAAMLLVAASPSARADLKLCNNTTSKVGVAIAYKDPKGWASEGWWTAEAKPEDATKQKCLTLQKGALRARYYYVYAVDMVKGGSWGGPAQICINDKEFTIRGIDKCEERGYQKKGFFEVDTGEETDWTLSLTGDKTTQGQ